MTHNLIVREPDLYFDSIHQELNNFLRDTLFINSFANPLNVKKNSTWRPAIEVKQTKEHYKVKVQLPGIKKDDIAIELDNDFMTITAEIEEEKEEQEEKEKNLKEEKLIGQFEGHRGALYVLLYRKAIDIYFTETNKELKIREFNYFIDNICFNKSSCKSRLS